MKTIDLPSDLNSDQTDTIDNSNCATSPSKSTYISSIPETIFYNGPGSETQPQIQNARKVNDLESCQIFAKNYPVPHKTRPTPVRISSEQSSVPRMQRTPPSLFLETVIRYDHPILNTKLTLHRPIKIILFLPFRLRSCLWMVLLIDLLNVDPDFVG